MARDEERGVGGEGLAGAPRKASSAEREWEEKVLEPALAKSPDRPVDFTTVSSYPIERIYTEA
ncbi:MAG TPA: hypothetical protein VMU48_15110, partial [Terracidiphilus sp.]|nr:hypothetical protein [Terracidiphilus sp.]